MGRNRSKNPKVIVTLRLRESLLHAYQAEGDDWRLRMEAALEATIAPSEATPEAASSPLAPKVKAKAQKASTAVPGRKPYGFSTDGTPLYR